MEPLKPGRHSWVGETSEATGSETDQYGELNNPPKQEHKDVFPN